MKMAKKNRKDGEGEPKKSAIYERRKKTVTFIVWPELSFWSLADCEENGPKYG